MVKVHGDRSGVPDNVKAFVWQGSLDHVGYVENVAYIDKDHLQVEIHDRNGKIAGEDRQHFDLYVHHDNNGNWITDNGSHQFAFIGWN